MNSAVTTAVQTGCYYVCYVFLFYGDDGIGWICAARNGS